MLIANPIYDTVFKYMMQNNRIARFFIETLLEVPVEEAALQPQEMTFPLPKDADIDTLVTLIRYDFVATIRLATGDYKKVLIEIQKVRHFVDLVRFRNYLGRHYSMKDEMKDNDRNTTVLPIVTIYLLGFTLPEIDTPVLKVANRYIDQINGHVIDRKSEFVEKLTHECHVVQIPRIEPKIGTKLEELISIFEQSNFVEGKKAVKEYNYPIKSEEMKETTKHLHYLVTDQVKRKELDAEEEAYRVFNLSESAVEDAKKRANKEIEAARKVADAATKEAEDAKKVADAAAKEAEDAKKVADAATKEAEDAKKVADAATKEAEAVKIAARKEVEDTRKEMGMEVDRVMKENMKALEDKDKALVAALKELEKLKKQQKDS